MKTITALVIALLLSLPLRAGDTPLVVVSIRQFLVMGDSNIHLYLYGLDGKLRKQLTSDAGQDDKHPQFSHDGKSVLFTRTTFDANRGSRSAPLILQLAGGTIKPAPAADALADYTPTVPILEFKNLAFYDPLPGDPYPAAGEHAAAFVAPDKSATLIQVTAPDEYNSNYQFKFAGPANPINTFPGYERTEASDAFLCDKEGPFLLGPDRYGALFVNRHLDSMWTFDLRRCDLVRQRRNLHRSR